MHLTNLAGLLSLGLWVISWSQVVIAAPTPLSGPKLLDEKVDPKDPHIPKIKALLAQGQKWLDKTDTFLEAIVVKKDKNAIAKMEIFAKGAENYKKMKMSQIHAMNRVLKNAQVHFKQLHGPLPIGGGLHALAVAHISNFPGFVDLGDLFWSLPEWEQIVTLIHETSHITAATGDKFTKNGNTYLPVQVGTQPKGQAFQAEIHEHFNDILTHAPDQIHHAAEFFGVLAYWVEYGKMPPVTAQRAHDNIEGSHASLGEGDYSLVAAPHVISAPSTAASSQNFGSVHSNDPMAQGMILGGPGATSPNPPSSPALSTGSFNEDMTKGTILDPKKRPTLHVNTGSTSQKGGPSSPKSKSPASGESWTHL